MQEDATAANQCQRDLQHLSSSLDAYDSLLQSIQKYKVRVEVVTHFYRKFMPAMAREMEASSTSRVTKLETFLSDARCTGILVDASQQAATCNVEAIKLQDVLQDMHEDAEKLHRTQRILEVCIACMHVGHRPSCTLHGRNQFALRCTSCMRYNPCRAHSCNRPVSHHDCMMYCHSSQFFFNQSGTVQQEKPSMAELTPFDCLLRDAGNLLAQKASLWSKRLKWDILTADIATASMLASSLKMAAVDKVACDVARELELWKQRDTANSVLDLQGITAQENALVACFSDNLRAWRQGLSFSSRLLSPSFTIKYRTLLVKALEPIWQSQHALGEAPETTFWVGGAPPSLDKKALLGEVRFSWIAACHYLRTHAWLCALSICNQGPSQHRA